MVKTLVICVRDRLLDSIFHYTGSNSRCDIFLWINDKSRKHLHLNQEGTNSNSDASDEGNS